MTSRYHDVYNSWMREPEAFWAEAAREIDWYKTWDKVFDPYAVSMGAGSSAPNATRPTTASIATLPMGVARNPR